MALEFTRLVNGTKLDEIQGQVDSLDSRVSTNETDISDIKTQLENLPTGGATITSQKYTDMTLLRNKVNELLSANRLCYLYIKTLKQYSAEGTEHSVNASGYTKADATIQIPYTSFNLYLQPARYKENNRVEFEGAGHILRLVSPDIATLMYQKVETNYTKGIVLNSAVVDISVLISGKYIEIYLCYM